MTEGREIETPPVFVYTVEYGGTTQCIYATLDGAKAAVECRYQPGRIVWIRLPEYQDERAVYRADEQDRSGNRSSTGRFILAWKLYA